MRLWTLSPSYLDAKGLVALWRETLLAQKVLMGQTRGYQNHPQLIRFKQTSNPVGAIATFLRVIADEAERRGYNFDRGKIANRRYSRKIPVTRGQVEYELQHLLAKLKHRDRARYLQLKKIKRIKLHPLFQAVKGGIEPWEVV